MGNSCPCTRDPELQFKDMLYEIYPKQQNNNNYNRDQKYFTSNIFGFQQTNGEVNGGIGNETNTARFFDDGTYSDVGGDENDENYHHHTVDSDIDENNNNRSVLKRFASFGEIDDAVGMDNKNKNNNNDKSKNYLSPQKSQSRNIQTSTFGSKNKNQSSMTITSSKNLSMNRYGVDYNRFALFELMNWVSRDQRRRVPLVFGKIVKILENDCLEFTNRLPSSMMQPLPRPPPISVQQREEKNENSESKTIIKEEEIPAESKLPTRAAPPPPSTSASSSSDSASQISNNNNINNIGKRKKMVVIRAPSEELAEEQERKKTEAAKAQDDVSTTAAEIKEQNNNENLQQAQQEGEKIKINIEVPHFSFAELSVEAQYYFDRILCSALILREFLESSASPKKQQNKIFTTLVIRSDTIDYYVPSILRVCEILIYQRAEPPLRITGAELFAVLCRKLSQMMTKNEIVMNHFQKQQILTNQQQQQAGLKSTSSSSPSPDANNFNNNESFSLLSSGNLNSTQQKESQHQTSGPSSPTGGLGVHTNYHEASRKLIISSQQDTSIPTVLGLSSVGFGTVSADALHLRYASLIAIGELAGVLGAWTPRSTSTLLELLQNLKLFLDTTIPVSGNNSSSNGNGNSNNSSVAQRMQQQEISNKNVMGTLNYSIFGGSNSSGNNNSSSKRISQKTKDQENLHQALRIACDQYFIQLQQQLNEDDDDDDDNDDGQNDNNSNAQKLVNAKIKIGPLTLDSVVRDWSILRVFLHAVSSVATSTTADEVESMIVEPVLNWITANRLWWGNNNNNNENNSNPEAKQQQQQDGSNINNSEIGNNNNNNNLNNPYDYQSKNYQQKQKKFSKMVFGGGQLDDGTSSPENENVNEQDHDEDEQNDNETLTPTKRHKRIRKNSMSGRQQEAEKLNNNNNDTIDSLQQQPPFSWIICRSIAQALEVRHEKGFDFLRKILERLIPLGFNNNAHDHHLYYNSKSYHQDSISRLRERIGMIKAITEVSAVLSMTSSSEETQQNNISGNYLSSSRPLIIVEAVKKCFLTHQPKNIAVPNTTTMKEGDDEEEILFAFLLQSQQRAAVDCITMITTRACLEGDWQSLLLITSALMKDLQNLLMLSSSSASIATTNTTTTAAFVNSNQHQQSLLDQNAQPSATPYAQRSLLFNQNQNFSPSPIPPNSSFRSVHTHNNNNTNLPRPTSTSAPSINKDNNNNNNNQINTLPFWTVLIRISPLLRYLTPQDRKKLNFIETITKIFVEFGEPLALRCLAHHLNGGGRPGGRTKMMNIPTSNQLVLSGFLNNNNNNANNSGNDEISKLYSNAPLIHLAQFETIHVYLNNEELLNSKNNQIIASSSIQTPLESENLLIRRLNLPLNTFSSSTTSSTPSRMHFPNSTASASPTPRYENNMVVVHQMNENNNNNASTILNAQEFIEQILFEKYFFPLLRSMIQKKKNLILLRQQEQAKKQQQEFEQQQQQMAARKKNNNINGGNVSSSSWGYSTISNVFLQQLQQSQVTRRNNMSEISNMLNQNNSNISNNNLIFGAGIVNSNYAMSNVNIKNNSMLDNGLSTPLGICSFVDFCKSYLNLVAKKILLDANVGGATSPKKRRNNNMNSSLLSSQPLSMPILIIRVALDFCQGFAHEELDFQKRVQERMTKFTQELADRRKKEEDEQNEKEKEKLKKEQEKQERLQANAQKIAGSAKTVVENKKPNEEQEEKVEEQNQIENKLQEASPVKTEPLDSPLSPQSQQPKSIFKLSEFATAWSFAALAVLNVIGTELQIPDLVTYARDLAKRRQETDERISILRQQQQQKNNTFGKRGNVANASPAPNTNNVSATMIFLNSISPANNRNTSFAPGETTTKDFFEDVELSSGSNKLVPPCFATRNCVLFRRRDDNTLPLHQRGSQQQRKKHLDDGDDNGDEEGGQSDDDDDDQQQQQNFNSSARNLSQKERLAPHNAGLVVVSGFEFDKLNRKNRTVCVENVSDFHLINEETVKSYLAQKYGKETVDEAWNQV